MAGISLPVIVVLVCYTTCFLFHAVEAVGNCKHSDLQTKKCVQGKDICISYNGVVASPSSLHNYSKAQDAEIECHYTRIISKTYPNYKATILTLSWSQNGEIVMRGDDNCKNLKRTLTLSPNIKEINLTCLATLTLHKTMEKNTTDSITFRYIPEVTTSTTTTTTTSTTTTTTPSTTTTTTTTKTTTPSTTTSTTTRTTAQPSTTVLTTTAKPPPPSTSPATTTTISTPTTATASEPKTEPTTTKSTTLPTSTPTTPTTTTATTITTESIPTIKEDKGGDNKNGEEDNRNDGYGNKNGEEDNKNGEEDNNDDGENDKSFVEKHWIPITAAVILITVVIVSVCITCAVLRTRKKQKEDKRCLNPNGSRNDLDVTPSLPGRANEVKINDYYSNASSDNTPEVYSDPYTAMYTQPVPKGFRRPPKIIPKLKPKPKTSYLDYSNTSEPEYNEPSTCNHIKTTGTTYNNIFTKNTKAVQFYDNMAASYANTDNGKYSDIYNEPALYEVPS